MPRGGAEAILWGCTEAQEGLRTTCKQEWSSRLHCTAAPWRHGCHSMTLFLPHPGDCMGIDSSWIRNQDSKCSCHTSCRMTPGVPCFFTLLISNWGPRQGTSLSWDVVPWLAAREAGKVSILHFQLLDKMWAWLRELSSQKEQLPPGLEMSGWI